METPIYFARDHADFIEGIERALGAPKPSSILTKYADRNSWAYCFNTIQEEFNGYEWR